MLFPIPAPLRILDRHLPLIYERATITKQRTNRVETGVIVERSTLLLEARFPAVLRTK